MSIISRQIGMSQESNLLYEIIRNLNTLTNVTSKINVPSNTFTGTIITAAGTLTAPPLQFTSGTLLTTPVAGAMEYDGTNIYITSTTVSGRGIIPATQQYILSSAGSALPATVSNFFGANSAISLSAATTYEIECFCYFLKTTAGTLTWSVVFSSATVAAHSYLEFTPVSGFTTTAASAAMGTSEVTQQSTINLTHGTTASLTSAVYHIAKFNIRVVTNAACNFRLNITQSAGTITPQAGSYYTVRKIVSNAGTFVA
jgi:hypothetical protein